MTYTKQVSQVSTMTHSCLPTYRLMIVGFMVQAIESTISEVKLSEECKICKLERSGSGRCVRPQRILEVRCHEHCHQDTIIANNWSFKAMAHHTFMESPTFCLPRDGERGIFPFSFHNRSGALDPMTQFPGSSF